MLVTLVSLHELYPRSRSWVSSAEVPELLSLKGLGLPFALLKHLRDCRLMTLQTVAKTALFYTEA